MPFLSDRCRIRPGRGSSIPSGTGRGKPSVDPGYINYDKNPTGGIQEFIGMEAAITSIEGTGDSGNYKVQGRVETGTGA